MRFIWGFLRTQENKIRKKKLIGLIIKFWENGSWTQGGPDMTFYLEGVKSRLTYQVKVDSLGNKNI